MQGMSAPRLAAVLFTVAACGGGGGDDGADAAAGADGAPRVDAGPGTDAAPLADARPIGDEPQQTCQFRVRFDGASSTLEGECRTYTPAPDGFEGRVVGPCVFTANSSGTSGTTVVSPTGMVTATGPGGAVTATADGNDHYARTQAAVIAAVGETLTLASTGGDVPAIPTTSFTRPADVAFAARPPTTISRAAGWTIAPDTGAPGSLRVTISQNMSSVYLRAVCTAPAGDTALTIPPEILTPFFYGDAFALFEALGTGTSTAGTFAVEAAAVGTVTADGASFGGQAIFLDD